MASGLHPFAVYLKAIGRGSTLGRPLDEIEAEAAFKMILDGEALPLQVGAFLLVLRYRTETATELAGFVRAARSRLAAGPEIAVDLDWPSYADSHKQLPYFLLAARLLAQSGTRVLMHGIAGAGAATTRHGLRALGIEPVLSLGNAATALDCTGFAYLPIETLCPGLAALFELRAQLGLRSPVNTVARELNPFRAAAQIQGVFHPTYLELHRETQTLLGQAHAVTFKGGGGEGQRNPEKACRVLALVDGQSSEVTWPALSEEPYPWRTEPLDADRLRALWQGEWQPAGPVAAVTGTLALALWTLRRAPDPAAARAMAERIWQARRQLPLAA